MSRDLRLLRSPISVVGLALAAVSAILFLIVFLAELLGLQTNPYTGIVAFLVLPVLFLAGWAIVPVGIWHERRRLARGRPPAETRWPRLDLNDPGQRRVAFIFVTLMAVNVVIVSLASYKGVEYMDTPAFCGQACHEPMKPEFVAHQVGAHSRVPCVTCHIGSGATSFVKAKASGVHRVLAVFENDYQRPIPTPVRSLRPARETCETCHWPEKYHGDKIVKVAEYAEDEQNSESITTLRVHVGGGSERLGTAEGIHWHMNVANVVEYIATDDQRDVIPWVRMTDSKGQVREYVADGVTPEQLAKGERRRMDCMDCHNRPSHPIAGTAERAVNEAMAAGLIPKTVPFIRREAVKAVKAAYPTQDAAAAGIGRALRAFYGENAPTGDVSAADVEKAVQGTIDVYARNVFPEMHVNFGTYANNIGHIDFPGCFRCHDDEHKTKEGKSIGQDCEACHAIE